jgi:L-fucose isomerase-like protein
MNQEETKTDLKAAMTSLLAAAASADAQQWSDVRTHLDETAEHCNRINDRLGRRREAVEMVPASGENGKP